MSYNRKNLLLKILDIQELVMKYQNDGYSQQWIYLNIIYPKYPISRATYYNYLNTNARKEIKELNQ